MELSVDVSLSISYLLHDNHDFKLKWHNIDAVKNQFEGEMWY